MTEKKRRMQTVSACVILLLMLGTLLSYFILPAVEDARIRETCKDPDVTVTDTARSPWIYTNSQCVFRVYPDKHLLSDTLVVPEVTNGYPNKSFTYPDYPIVRIKTLVLPRTVTFWAVQGGLCHDWLALETLVLSDGIEEVPAMTFGNVPALREIYLPASVTYLKGITVPDEVAPGFTVHYAGTEEEWLALGAAAQRLSEIYTVRYESAYEK